MNKFPVFCLHVNEGRKLKTKDSMRNMHLNNYFWSFFCGKKCALYMVKYGIQNIWDCTKYLVVP